MCARLGVEEDDRFAPERARHEREQHSLPLVLLVRSEPYELLLQLGRHVEGGVDLGQDQGWGQDWGWGGGWGWGWG